MNHKLKFLTLVCSSFFMKSVATEGEEVFLLKPHNKPESSADVVNYVEEVDVKCACSKPKMQPKPLTATTTNTDEKEPVASTMRNGDETANVNPYKDRIVEAFTILLNVAQETGNTYLEEEIQKVLQMVECEASAENAQPIQEEVETEAIN